MKKSSDKEFEDEQLKKDLEQEDLIKKMKEEFLK